MGRKYHFVDEGAPSHGRTRLAALLGEIPKLGWLAVRSLASRLSLTRQMMLSLKQGIFQLETLLKASGQCQEQISKSIIENQSPSLVKSQFGKTEQRNRETQPNALPSGQSIQAKRPETEHQQKRKLIKKEKVEIKAREGKYFPIFHHLYQKPRYMDFEARWSRFDVITPETPVGMHQRTLDLSMHMRILQKAIESCEELGQSTQAVKHEAGKAASSYCSDSKSRSDSQKRIAQMRINESQRQKRKQEFNSQYMESYSEEVGERVIRKQYDISEIISIARRAGCSSQSQQVKQQVRSEQGQADQRAPSQPVCAVSDVRSASAHNMASEVGTNPAMIQESSNKISMAGFIHKQTHGVGQDCSPVVSAAGLLQAQDNIAQPHYHSNSYVNPAWFCFPLMNAHAQLAAPSHQPGPAINNGTTVPYQSQQPPSLIGMLSLPMKSHAVSLFGSSHSDPELLKSLSLRLDRKKRGREERVL